MESAPESLQVQLTLTEKTQKIDSFVTGSVFLPLYNTLCLLLHYLPSDTVNDFFRLPHNASLFVGLKGGFRVEISYLWEN